MYTTELREGDNLQLEGKKDGIIKIIIKKIRKKSVRIGIKGNCKITKT